ncbi:histidine phosphatase family protein, partial [Candidatus Woesearchaeota archaeon]|nr:histidine phosphatase family protein [Candidatus Woesearchaeota archaeon]
MIEGYNVIIHRHGEPYVHQTSKASQDLLTPHGLTQGAIAGKKYRGIESKVTLGSSPAYRAKQTVGAIHSGIGRLDIATPYEVHALLQGDALKAAGAKFPTGVDFGEDWIAQTLKESPNPQAVIDAQGNRYLDFLAQRILANAGKGDTYDINVGHAPCGSLAAASLAGVKLSDVPQLAESYLDAVVFEVHYDTTAEEVKGALMEDFRGTGRVDITDRLRAKLKEIE